MIIYCAKSAEIGAGGESSSLYLPEKSLATPDVAPTTTTTTLDKKFSKRRREFALNSSFYLFSADELALFSVDSPPPSAP